MSGFSYRAQGRDGKEIRGEIFAESEQEAVFRIRENYPVLLEIRKHSERKRIENILNMEIGSRRISEKELSVFCTQMAVTLRAGIPVARAVGILAGQCSDRRFRKILEAVAAETAAGSSMADALGKYEEQFSQIFIETIRAGEQSGTLVKSFERLHSFYDRSYKTAQKVKSALTYPAFVAATAVVVLIVVMVKVIPMLSKIFDGFGSELPLITKIMIECSDFLSDWWSVILAAAAFLAVGLQIDARTPDGRLRKAKLSLLMPLSGKIMQMNASAQFAGAMSVFISAGLTLDHAVGISARIMDNAVFQKEVLQMKEKIVQGQTLSECMRKSSYFPQALTDMCSVGEEIGELEQAFAHAEEYYSNEADYMSQRLLTMLEPAILMILSVLAGFIVIAVYLPIFSMYDLM